MAGEELLVTLGVQDKGANKQITALNRELKNLDKQYKSSSTISKEYEKTLSGLQNKFQYLNEKILVNQTKLSSYNKKLQETQQAIRAKEQELNNLNNAENVNQQAVAKATEQLERMKSTLRGTESNIKLTENEIARLNNQLTETGRAIQNHSLEQYKQQIQQIGENIQSTGNKISNFGSGMSTVGNSIMALSAPMIAFGAYATKTSIDFEQAMANLQATSGATGEEFTALENKSKELGENTCKSATDSANAMQFLALAGYSVNQILSSTEPILKASVAWGADMATSADLATDSMSALGMSTDRLTEYLDVCSQAQRSSNTTATQLMEAYIGCGGTLKTLGVPLQESATWLGILANQGKKGSEAGNNLNSILVNLVGASSSADSAMKSLGVSAWDNNGNFIGLTATLNLLQKALSSCTQEQRTNFQAAIGGKTQLDTLNMLLAGVGDQYDSLRGKIDSASGATEEMYKIMNDTAQGKIEAFKSKVEALGIKIGDQLVPHLNDLLDKLMNLIDWFSNLDQSTQSAILSFGLLTFATGGLLSAAGKVVTNVGGLVTWVGKLTTAAGAGATATGELGGALGLLSSVAGPLAIAIAGVSSAVALYNKEQKAFSNSVVTSREDMGALEAALLSLNGVHVKSREELEASGLVYKEFGDNISDSFKTAVNNATKDINTFSVKLSEISLDNVLTDEETADFTARLESTVDSAIQTIESKKTESQSQMNELFKFDDGVIDETEQAIIDLCTKEFETEAEEVRKNQSQINDIYNQARTEGRALTPEEIASIKEYYANIKQIELECKAENSSELEYSEIDFKNRMKNLDAQGASELLVQKKQELDEQLIQKENQYDQIIAIAQRQAEQLNGEERTAAEERVEQLKQKKQESIDTFNNQWEEYKNIVQQNAPDLSGTINQYTGEILSDMDLKMQQGLEFTKSHLDGLNSVNEEGWYRMYNTATQSMDDIYITVDQNTGEITACWDQTTGECNGYTEDMANKVKELGEQHESQKLTITQSLADIAGAYVNTNGEMVNSMGEVISQLYNVTETSQGTITAIADINGTPIQIETNSDGVILSMHQVGNSMSDVSIKAEETSNEVKSKFQGAADAMPGVGGNIVNGIGSGIDSHKGGLFSKISSLCSQLVQAAKNALDIHSPSRVFKNIIGKNITLGINEGILAESGTLNATMQNILDSAKNSSSTSIKSFDSLGDKIVDSLKNGVKDRKSKLKDEMQKLVDENLERLKEVNNYDSKYYDSIGKGYTAEITEEVNRAFKIVAGDQEAINEKWRENNKKTIDEIKQEAQKTIDKWNEDSSKKASDYYTKLYKQDLESASKTLMTQYEKTIEQGLTDATTKIDTAISKLSKQTETKYNDLVQRQKSMKDKLNGLGELYEEDDGEIKLANLEDTIDDMKMYRNCLQQIKDIGTPKSFLQEIEGLDIEKANKVMIKLLNMDNESYWNFIDKFEEKQRLANSISKNYYKDQIADVEDNFTKKLTEIIGTVPDTMHTIGQQALQGFLNGMDSETQRLLQASTDIANDITNSFRTAFDIHSPSRVFRQIGSYVSEGLGLGITDELAAVNVNIEKSLGGTIDITKNNLLNGFDGIKEKLNNILLSGSYYNANSKESRDLISTTNNRITTNNYDNSKIIDYNKLSNILVAAIAKGLNINVNVDADGIVERSTNNTIRKLDKMYSE